MPDRSVAPSNQWPVKGGKGADGIYAARPMLLYPAQDYDSGVWGWTEFASEAEGIVDVEDGVLGVDDSTTVGGARVMNFDGAIAALVTS